MIDDLISKLIYREENNSQKREAEKTGSRAWPKVSQVDEEATEGMEMGSGKAGGSCFHLSMLG